MKIGCCIDVGDLKEIVEAGYDFVDLNGQELAAMPLDEVEAIGAYLRQNAVSCAGLHATVPARVRLAGPDFCLNDVREYAEALAERARILKVRCLGIGSPASRRLPEGFLTDLADEQMGRALETFAAAYPDGMVLLESLNRTETNYINSIGHAARIVDRAKNRRIGLVLDVYHFVLCGDALDGLDDQTLKKIRYIHIADPVGRRFPSDETDPALFALAREVVRMAGVEEIAVEARAQDLQREARTALNILKKMI